MANSPDNSQWIIQRCTQRWIGSELQYEDFPASAAQREPWPYPSPMTRSTMLEALGYSNEHWPGDEFRGHRVDLKAPRRAPPLIFALEADVQGMETMGAAGLPNTRFPSTGVHYCPP